MTSNAVPAGGDPRRLLEQARELARRVRLAQQVTWLPLLVLGVVTFGAILAYRFGHPVVSHCQEIPNGRVCAAFARTPAIYWWTALVLAYVLIAAGYLQVARSRGLGTRVLPYVLTGLGLVALSGAVTATFLALDYPFFPDGPPTIVDLLIGFIEPSGAIGVALLVLAWLERRVALALFAVGYLVVALVPVNFGWGVGWGERWGAAPQLVIDGSVLLLGSAGFALAQRLRRPR
jgi:hypothetical protein